MDIFEFRGRAQSRLDQALEDLAAQVIGAAIEVHRHLGPGLSENVYRLALSHELTLRDIPFEIEVPVPIVYKGQPVGAGRLDMLVDKRLILELKVVEKLADVHRAQCIFYLAATGLQLALLINFNVAVLKHGIKRVINSSNPKLRV